MESISANLGNVLGIDRSSESFKMVRNLLISPLKDMQMMIKLENDRREQSVQIFEMATILFDQRLLLTAF
jgi:hypothetical protein